MRIVIETEKKEKGSRKEERNEDGKLCKVFAQTEKK
jgi:hypothetical protein